jgi:pyruvate dehydrogenase E1 component alpha subunit
MLTAIELIDFEKEVACAFEAGKIRGPVHLSGGNEEALLEIFGRINPEDWKFSTWRNHYHALLSGVHRDWLMAEILAGRSMNLMSPEHRFFTSAIVGGCLPIAVGVAAALKRQNYGGKVWCFVGDMGGTTGIFHESSTYAYCNSLPITFVVEDNGVSTDSPTLECWGELSPIFLSVPEARNPYVNRYRYERTYPHVNTGKFVNFNEL